jgi:excisionase family DNA binding protein
VVLAGKTPQIRTRNRGIGPPPAPPGDGEIDQPRPPPAGRCPDGQPPIPPATRSPTPPSHQPWRPNPGGSLAQLEVLKVREAAAILRVGHNQLYQSVARGELPAVRIGRTIRIPKAALADLLTTVPEPVAPAAAPE